MFDGLTLEHLQVESLGPATVPSPLVRFKPGKFEDMRFRSEEVRVRVDPYVSDGAEEPGPEASLSFERAGPREHLYFDPRKTRVAIITCGGLCPGINDVIRALVLQLHHWYGVHEVFGIRYGYSGLSAYAKHSPLRLEPDLVDDIHKRGGTILGSSRGSPPVGEMVDTLVNRGINILFTIGGDGTLRGAYEISEEVRRRNVPMAVIGIPKTIDNDIPLVYHSFGFETAVEEARKVLECAHVESKGAANGVGLVKLMGRHAGFIAAYATRASGDVNFCLVPEVPFPLHGEGGLLENLRVRLRQRQHAVIAVAEGAGQHLVGEGEERDASGNVKFKDIGLFLKEEIGKAFAAWGEPVNVKYFDPSYTIRSVPATGQDSIFCADLARHAVHAGMAGKTAMLVGYWHGVFTNVPLRAIQKRRKPMRPTASLWVSVLSSTGQPTQWG